MPHRQASRGLRLLALLVLLAAPRPSASAPPRPAARAQTFVEDAREALARGNQVEAEAFLRAAWDASGDAAPLLQLAAELQDAEERDLAVAVLALAHELSGAPAALDRLEAIAQAASDAGEIEVTIDLLRRVWLLGGDPKQLANLGRLHQVQGRPVRAADYLARFLREAPAHERAPVVRQFLSGLAEELGRTHTRVQVTSSPPGAAVTLSDEQGEREPGRTPLELWLPRGAVTLHLAHQDHHPAHLDLTVTPDGPTAVEASLEPLEPPPPPAPDPDPSAPTDPPLVTAAPEPAGFTVPIATWVAGGVALTSLVVGAALAGVASSHGRDTRSYGADPTADPDRWDAQVAEVEALAIGADVCFGLAGAAAITGAVLLFALQGDDEEPAADLTLVPAAGPRGGGLVLTGSF